MTRIGMAEGSCLGVLASSAAVYESNESTILGLSPATKGGAERARTRLLNPWT
jgi:hypothetical protein